MTLLDYQPSPTDDGREYEFPHDFDKLGNLLEEAERCAWEISAMQWCEFSVCVT